MSVIYLPEPTLIANRIIVWRDVMRAELDYPTSSLGPLFYLQTIYRPAFIILTL